MSHVSLLALRPSCRHQKKADTVERSYISTKLNPIIMKLETHVKHGIWRVCTKFGENRTIGGAVIQIYLESRI